MKAGFSVKTAQWKPQHPEVFDWSLEGFWFGSAAVSLQGGSSGSHPIEPSRELGRPALTALWSLLAVEANWVCLHCTDADALQKSSPSKSVQVRVGIGGEIWINAWFHVTQFDSELLFPERSTWRVPSLLDTKVACALTHFHFKAHSFCYLFAQHPHHSSIKKWDFWNRCCLGFSLKTRCYLVWMGRNWDFWNTNVHFVIGLNC